MDIAWLILDSLSFRATPFAEDGPDTMLRFEELATNRGVVFRNAYAPGPLSPSSSGTIFTGELPSTTGMHEAHPYFRSEVPTIAGTLADTHRTHLISLNMWLSQGLADDFDLFEDFTRQYLLFRDATDPVDHFGKYKSDGNFLRDLYRFARHDGKPLRSLANYVSHRISDETLVPEEWGDERNYQYANRINQRILDAMDATDNVFALGSYMDVHPPFDPSEDALDRFAPETPRSELPVNTYPERHISNDEKSYAPEAMETVYRACIWDLDRKVTPLIESLVDDETFVVVTSDHGIWDRDNAYSENRLHVPLVVFAPSEPPRTIDQTVNLASLPKTTMAAIDAEVDQFPGVDLCSVSDDQLLVSEIIHYPNEVYEKTGRVDVTKTLEGESTFRRDLVLVEGDARVTCLDGEWTQDRGSGEACRRLQEKGESMATQPVAGTEWESRDYDPQTQRRLEDLGYI
jgi:arylsulfatase A-like enzyme